MNKYKIILLDVDGVLINAPRLFSEVYCQKYNVDLKKLEPFYESKEFKACSIGQMDLKEAILAHNDKWHWKGDPSDLINEWLQAENFPNNDLLEIVKELRNDGVKVYVVTQQERYRRDFLSKIVFKDKFDGFFASCDLGFPKDTIDFWQKLLTEILENNQNLAPEDIAYFDDKQKLVDLASTKGIRGFLYTDVEDVMNALI